MYRRRNIYSRHQNIDLEVWNRERKKPPALRPGGLGNPSKMDDSPLEMIFPKPSDPKAGGAMDP